jgi:hypothetical protein
VSCRVLSARCWNSSVSSKLRGAGLRRRSSRHAEQIGRVKGHVYAPGAPLFRVFDYEFWLTALIVTCRSLRRD